MSSPSAIPLLSLLVWLPLAGAIALVVHGRAPSDRRRAIGLAASLPSLILSALVVASYDSTGPPVQLIELYSWVPALGVSYDLGVDGLSAVLACWLALVATLSLALSGGGRETSPLLLLETSLLGLAVARDALLFLSFYGAAILSVCWLLESDDSRRRWFGHQLAGLVLFAGFFLYCYRLALDQTGFPSAELGRLRSLVIFPAEERRLFVLAGLGAWIAAPLPPFLSWVVRALEGLSPAGRTIFLGGVVLVPPYALVRVALPVTPDGAASWSGGLALLALASVTYAALAPRRLGLAPFVVGLQGLLFAALVAPPPADVPAEVGLLATGVGSAALALYGSASPPSRALSERPHPVGAILALVVVGLVAWPLGWGWLAPVARGSAWVFAALALVVTAAAIRLALATGAVAPRRRALLVLPVLAFWIALLVAPREWTARLGPPASPVAPAEGAAEEEP